MYPNDAQKSFDLSYYQDSHLALVKEKYGSYGLTHIELDIAVTTSGKQAAPYLAIGYLCFETIEQFFEAYKAEGKVVMDDLPNFTDIQPVVQISKFHSL